MKNIELTAEMMPNDVLSTIAKEAGVHVAMKVWEEHAGTQAYFPKKLGGEIVRETVARNPQASMDEIAHSCHVSRKTVYRNCAYETKKNRNNL